MVHSSYSPNNANVDFINLKHFYARPACMHATQLDIRKSGVYRKRGSKTGLEKRGLKNGASPVFYTPI